MNWFRGLLAVHILFFAGWGGYLLTSHQNAGTIWLETAPIDPRDYLSGHFVALRFSELEQRCTTLNEGAFMIYVRLEPSAKKLSTYDGIKTVWHAAECSADPPQPSDSRTWILGTRDLQKRRVNFGIERFYVPETSPLRSVRSGDVVAKIAVNRQHIPRILDLVRIK